MKKKELEKLKLKRKKALKIYKTMPKFDAGNVSCWAFWSTVAGGFLGSFMGWGGFGKLWYEQTIEEKTPEIKDAILKIAQEKSNQFNENMEKYNVSIPVPTSAGELSYDIIEVSKIKDVNCEAIENVRENIFNTISNDLIEVGDIKGSVHVWHHNFMLDATSSDALLRPSSGDSTFDAYKFLVEKMGDGLDTEINEVANSIAPSTNEGFIGGLMGFGLGLIPAGVIISVPLLCKAAEKHYEKKAKEYEKEYRALCERDGVWDESAYMRY